jgi:hypothetical protein
MNREQKAAHAASVAAVCALLCIAIFVIVSLIHVLGRFA